MLIETVYSNKTLIRESHSIGSIETKPIIEKIYNIWPSEFLNRSVEKQSLGLTKIGHRVDEPSAMLYAWRPVSRGLAKMYNVSNLEDLKVKGWYGRRFCFNSKKVQLKVPYELEIPHPELPDLAFSIFYANTYEKNLGEITQFRDVYFKATKADVNAWCIKNNVNEPDNVLDKPNLYGIVFDKETLEIIKIKSYQHTQF